jgi:uncharacterized RDD family membrane protein YckC
VEGLETSEVDFTALESKAEIAGFWRRVAASAVDALVLGAIGWVIAIVMYDELVAAGGWALVGGFAISVTYFGVLNSHLGPTPGKRLLKIRVVDREGRAIPVPRSVLRAVLLAVPFFLNGAPLPEFVLSSPALLWLQGLVVFGVGGTILLLFVFNRATRQSLHDLLVGTFVVRTAGPGTIPRVTAIPRWTYAATAAVLLAGVALLALFWVSMRRVTGDSGAAIVERLAPAREAVLRHPNVLSAVLWHSLTSPAGPGKSTASLVVQILRWPESEDQHAAELAQLALRAGLECGDADQLVVRLARGYNMGIARASFSKSFIKTCSEWRGVDSRP